MPDGSLEYFRSLLAIHGKMLRQTKEIVRESAAAGVPITEIHDALGIARTTIYRWLRE